MRFRFWVIIAAGLFIIGILAGIEVRNTMPADIAGIFSGQEDALGNIADSLGTSRVAILIFIYFKNALAVIISFLFSPFFCLIPVIALLFNSAFISYISIEVIKEKSLGFLLAGVLPHGIFEIPALLIGEAASLSFGVAAIIALFSRARGEKLRNSFKENFKYLLISLALLGPAAIMETFVTPLFLR
jgi:stage II sporulation protein M